MKLFRLIPCRALCVLIEGCGVAPFAVHLSLMTTLRIALANLRFPGSPDEAVAMATGAVALAGSQGADIVCFPECYVPGYRAKNKQIPPPDPAFLDHAWNEVAQAAAKGNVAVILGTERVVNGSLVATSLIIGKNGLSVGFQDKVQIDPSEEGTYVHGVGRKIFEINGVKLGIVICHEGWRYPETVRWATRRGAKIVFHPHFHEAEPGGYIPSSFADPANSFHEKSILCRAAENTCWFASVNCASYGSPTTSAIVRPDGTLLSFQPYGEEGLLVADIDLEAATCLLATRCRTDAMAASGELAFR